MKNTLLVLSALTLAAGAAGCKKNYTNSALDGSWERRVTYGFTGRIEYPEGNGNGMDFQGNGYSSFVNGTPGHTGTFRLAPDWFYQSNEKGWRIVFDGELTSKQFYELKGDTLSIFDDRSVSDGGMIQYVRRQSFFLQPE